MREGKGRGVEADVELRSKGGDAVETKHPLPHLERQRRVDLRLPGSISSPLPEWTTSLQEFELLSSPTQPKVPSSALQDPPPL